jgi:Uncharacterized conserved protein
MVVASRWSRERAQHHAGSDSQRRDAFARGHSGGVGPFSSGLGSVNTIHLKCSCGAVEIRVNGQPLMQYVCHCDDCQAVHGAAYACAVYPASAIVVIGETCVTVLKTSPRTKCSGCGTYLFAEIPGRPVRGVNGALFPEGAFVAEYHIQCWFAKKPITDELPHFKGLPVRFGGSGELMQW